MIKSGGLIILVLLLLSCGDQAGKGRTEIQVNEEVLRLKNSPISYIKFLNNKDSCRKAILYLDSAIALDKNCYTCYSNKIVFLNALKDRPAAISAINECIRLKPTSYDLYLQAGVLYEKTGDTLTSRKYFKKALQYCAAKTDQDRGKTFKEPGDHDWYVVRADYAIILKLLGRDSAANSMLTNLYLTKPGELEDSATIRKSIRYLLNSDRKLILDSTFQN